IMEPFRPIIDRAVKNFNPTKFDTEEKYFILSLLSMELFVDGKKQNLLNVIKIYSKSVFEAIESGDTANIKIYRYEL
ncbi:MAG: type II CRISPR-associated endonuclease Cas1, partial [Eubacterium sp.]|nr:type II CRISPR-associated endonuclease Cas1 [Eubacterium sp.]